MIKIKKLNENAVIPTYATPGSACFDLYASESTDGSVASTGLAFEIPEGSVMLLFSRSGHGAKGIRLSNCVGVIDSDYRGEVKVMLHSDKGVPLAITRGDRVAQAMILQLNQVTFEEVDQLSSTERGSGGFGSTGK